MSLFPFVPEIQISKDLVVSYTEVLKYIGPLLTTERLARIDKVVRHRIYSVCMVLENIYDRGNSSAVIRSAEAMGFGSVHMIELGEKFKESQRTTAGADKWVEVKKWKSTRDCIEQLKKNGMQIVVTHLDARSCPIDEVDFSKPSALVLGNEKTGVSQEMIEAADHRVILPMTGFVQSFNISVAGALASWHMFKDRQKRLGDYSDLSIKEQEILKAIYYLRTQDSAADTLRELRARGEL